MQTKAESFVEAVLSTFIGYFVSLAVWPIAGWVFNYDYSHIHPIGTTALFTLASVIRGYAIRRWCDRYLKQFSAWLVRELTRED
jgi:ABC-type transport system involved in cytochrome bd biosynthesis fused ATPase/permease subunit